MAAAHPISFVLDPKQAWIAQQLEMLTPEERAKYDRDASFRGVVDTCLAQEWRCPDGAALAREAHERYGDDFERRGADLEAGLHPYQRPR